MTDTQKRKRARPTIYGEKMVKIGLLVRMVYDVYNKPNRQQRGRKRQ